MKCANCGSDMRYDVSVVGLVCDYCGTVKNLPKPEDEQVIEDMDFGTAIRGAATDWEGLLSVGAAELRCSILRSRCQESVLTAVRP